MKPEEVQYDTWYPAIDSNGQSRQWDNDRVVIAIATGPAFDQGDGTGAPPERVDIKEALIKEQDEKIVTLQKQNQKLQIYESKTKEYESKIQNYEHKLNQIAEIIELEKEKPGE